MVSLPAARAETEFIPSVILSQRYDSNVFYGPKEFIPSGRQAWDFVTTAGTQMQILNKSRLGDTAISAGVDGNVFAYNTDLSFVSANVNATSDLSGWAHDLLPGLSLQISDRFLYTPEPPAFLTGGVPSDAADVFSRGIQTVRANTFKNVLTVGSHYSVSRSVGLRADYYHSLYRAGRLSLLSAVPVVFFDTTVHTVTTGPTFKFGGRDTLFLPYSYSAGETASSVTTINYAVHTLQPEYVSGFFPGYTLTVSAGATMVEQAGNRAFFSGRLSLFTNYDRRTVVGMSLSRRAAPAFFGIGGAIISNAAQLSFSHGLSRVLRLIVLGNYAYNESTPVDVFTFTSITGSARLEYKMTRSTQLALSQEYNRFSYTGIPTFDRYATMLMLSTAWN